MARKRKSRATEAPQEPESVQETEPVPVPELELEQPLEEEAPGVGIEVVEEEEEVEVEVEVEEEERDGEDEEEQPENMEEDKQPDAVSIESEDDKRPEAVATGMEEHKQDETVATELEEDKQANTVATDPEKNDEGVEIKDKPSVTENGQGQDKDEGAEELEEEEPLEKLLEPFSRDQLTLLIKEAVAKHPDVIESVHRLADADPAHCKIFVHGLGWEASTETITSEFRKYGEIQDCKVVKDKVSGKSKGYAFILFKHRNGARRALKQPQKTIDGRLASCQLASAGPVQTPAPAAVATVSTTPANEYTQRKIFVSNVAADLDPRKLLKFFSEFGEIEEGPLGLDKQTGKPRGFCLFVYKSLEGAKNALEEPHKNYEDHILHCQKAVDGPKHTKGFFNQHHGQPYHHGQQNYYNHPAKKGKYAGRSGVGHTGGHLMAPSGGVSSAGFNQAVAPEAIGQAVAALLASQGAGLGFGNLLGGIGAGVNPQGVPPMMNNGGYGGQGGGGGYGGQLGGGYGGQPGGGGYGGQHGGGYGVQPGMQGGYGGQQQQQQMGQGGVRPNQGGTPYMGHGI